MYRTVLLANSIRSLLCLALLLAQACTPEIKAPKTRAELATLPKSWLMRASVSIIDDKRRFLFQANWRQNNQDFDLNLHSLFGMQQLRLTKNGNQLAVNDQPINRSLDAWLWWRYRLRLPIERLPDWLLPQTPIPQRIDGSWHIEYLAYQAWQRWQIPQKMRITNDNLTITMAIQQFDALPGLE